MPRTVPFPARRALRRSLAAAILAVLTLAVTGTTRAATPPFEVWLEDLRKEALARGIGAETVARALDGVQPIQRVIELDRRQPEFTQTFWDYLNKRVTEDRIRRGRELLAKHRVLLDGIAKRYGVQPRFLVSFWAHESNFGDYTGVFPLVPALATLAHDPRRANFFREQLFAALLIMDRGDIAVDVKASWAGAMGQTQFLPTTYRDFAVDGDGDGRRDLWGSLPDIFASSAHYLARVGWDGERTWGREVRLPKGLDLELVGLDTRKPLAEWQGLGVRRMDGRDLPRVEIEASLILPAGVNGPAFLVYKNFRAILVWNRSLLYAVAVGHLADRLVGKPRFLTPPRKEIALSRADVKEIQRRLTQLGFDPGGIDGVAGPATRKKIRAFQRKSHLPPDGHPSAGLLERLRGATSR